MPTDNFHSNKIWKDCDCLLPRHAISARHASLVADTATRRLQTGSSCFRLRPWYVPVLLPRRLHLAYWSQWTAEASFSTTRWLIRASHKDQSWQVQFPSCCTAIMELYHYISVHQPSAEISSGWTQIPPVQVRLHMTLLPRTIEEWTN